jgi:hypothetical protein
MIRAFSIALAAGLIAGGAQAQETISTAANAPSAGAPAPASPATGAPIALSDNRPRFDDGGPLPVGPCGAVGQVDKDGVVQKPDRNPHGQVWAGVGTAGYREIGGAVCLPIGDHAAVNIAVDSARIGGR